MEVPMLVGLQNKDLFDVQTEWVNQDNRYYVDDVNQVKPMPIQGVQQGELAMLQMMDRSLDGLSVDPAQQGQTTRGEQTATEARIADERARELKGIIYMYLEDLWLQKNRLRSKTILNHYLKDKATQKGIKDNIITVKDYAFGNGVKGQFDIHLASSKSKLLSVQEIDARKQAMVEQGIPNYELISIPAQYFEGHSIDWTVVPESLHNQDRITKEPDVMDKMQRVVTLFPERFAANKDKFFGELMGVYGDNPDDYPAPPPEQPQGPQAQQTGQPPLPNNPVQAGGDALSEGTSLLGQ